MQIGKPNFLSDISELSLPRKLSLAAYAVHQRGQ